MIQEYIDAAEGITHDTTTIRLGMVFSEWLNGGATTPITPWLAHSLIAARESAHKCKRGWDQENDALAREQVNHALFVYGVEGVLHCDGKPLVDTNDEGGKKSIQAGLELGRRVWNAAYSAAMRSPSETQSHDKIRDAYEIAIRQRAIEEYRCGDTIKVGVIEPDENGNRGVVSDITLSFDHSKSAWQITINGVIQHESTNTAFDNQWDLAVQAFRGTVVAYLDHRKGLRKAGKTPTRFMHRPAMSSVADHPSKSDSAASLRHAVNLGTAEAAPSTNVGATLSAFEGPTLTSKDFDRLRPFIIACVMEGIRGKEPGR